MLCRLIAAKWAEDKGLSPRTHEGFYTLEELQDFNLQGYNAYLFPNYPSEDRYEKFAINPRTGLKRNVKGSDTNVFEWVFVDLDMKDYLSENADRRHEYESKDAFVIALLDAEIKPSRIVDSGNGVHAYWRVTDLDAKSFLRLNRRLCRKFHTDPAVCTLNQLMRVPNTLNVKNENDFKHAEILLEDGSEYSCETLNKWLPPIELKDEAYCVEHYESICNPDARKLKVSTELPVAFLQLCKRNGEVRSLFYEPQKDRSSADFRLGHLLYSGGLSKEEAMAVLMQTAKAIERTPNHRYNYAAHIVSKIFPEKSPPVKSLAKEDLTQISAPDGDEQAFHPMSQTIDEIMNKAGDASIEGIRFHGHETLDATAHGFRLGEVMGLIGGQGNGKTTVALNNFIWFNERNPDYDHLYVSLEQPKEEIALRWHKMTEGKNLGARTRVHVLDNYNPDGSYRSLGLMDLQEYVLGLEKHTGRKIGCVVLDHIGILKEEKGQGGDFGGLIKNCERLKSFAVATKTFFIVQSQTTREKNGGGDIELDLDAAYGTSKFESFVDYVLTCWQPLKRVYNRMSDKKVYVIAFKICKNRHRDELKDRLKMDTIYPWSFDPTNDTLTEMTSDQHKVYDWFNQIATQIRNRDKKKQPNTINTITWSTVLVTSPKK